MHSVKPHIGQHFGGCCHPTTGGFISRGTVGKLARMPRYPYLTLPQSLLLLRVGTAGFFMAHALARILYGSIPQFALYLGGLGFPAPLLWVWAITAYEIVGGTALILGYHTRFAALGLFCIALGGIVLIHARLGWFVGEHGTGGSEYSVCLMLCLIVLAAADAKPVAPQLSA